MRKRPVTAEQFIDLVLERMRRGMSYEDASAPYTTDVEDEPARTADGVREVLEVMLDATDDENALAIAEREAYTTGKYEAVGWEPPPEDPLRELELRISELIDDNRIKVLHRAIGELSKQEQAVSHAMFWDDAPQASIARGLGISRQAVNSAYCRALAKLREAFGLENADLSRVKRPRLTQDEMDVIVITRQRRKGAAIDARLARLRSAGLA